MKLIINNEEKHFAETTLTVSQLIVSLNLGGKRIAIERNGEIVPKSLFETTVLREQDRLEIITAVGGG